VARLRLEQNARERGKEACRTGLGNAEIGHRGASPKLTFRLRRVNRKIYTLRYLLSSRTDMEIVTRPCRPGDERALSLVAQATILETYAGIANGDDLITYVNDELRAPDFARMLVNERVRAWISETTVGKCPVGYAVAVSGEGSELSSFELKRLYIFYRFHGMRIGKRLMEDVLAFGSQENSEKIWLQEANHHAIEFYKRFGFVQRGVDLFHAGDYSYRVLTLALTLKYA
jgi:GNAT superfamily N-acetyltransferase